MEIRVKAFQDLVDPPNRWTPPSNHALIAERHLLRVAVASGAAGTEDVFADIDPGTAVVKAETKLANEVYLPEKLVIPANGYLVLAVGTDAQHGIQGSTAKLVDKAKLSAALQLYSIKSEFGLPYPGNDLAVFLRNGGTIELYHRDIAANTTAKADDNGYQAAAAAHAADSVVISEIMWGSDASLGEAYAAKSQWIELHNTTDAAISIDKYEWLLAFVAGSGAGTTETFDLTLIDTVSNASPYWAAPGSSGATTAQRRVDVVDDDQEGDPIVASIFESFDLGTLTSMYRKIDGTAVSSGTSPDSWAASSSAGTLNFSGLRAGTPGAATPYTAPEAAPEPEPTPEPPAPVATAR